MKKILLSIIIIICSTALFAQAPEAYKYQAIVRNGTGSIIANQKVNFRITILSGSITGTSIYTETQTDTTDAFGMVNLNIGKGITSNNFSTIDWGGNNHFIKIEIDETGGTSFKIMGTTQLLSVPYALYSKKAENGLTAEDVTKLSSIEEGAEINVNANWNAISGDDEILNKPYLKTSKTGDTLFFGNTNFVLIPGISEANQISLTTTVISDITANSASSGGIVKYDGHSSIIARGVCWSSEENPTISDNHTTDGSGLGTFTSNITGLNPDTKYYVKAYALNINDTAYGNQVDFTTRNGLPIITTSQISNITSSSATCGGNIIENGGFDVTSRGVCWSIHTNPTINDFKTIDSLGIGIFTSNITGLIENTTYYLRAYATNSIGTSYGSEVVFLAKNPDGTGTFEDPYNVSYTIQNNSELYKWVQGFIVGVYETVDASGNPLSEFTPSFTAPFYTNSNILIAENENETNLANCVVVQLTLGDIRTPLNLTDNPTNKNKQVKVLGDLQSYFSMAGIKNTSGYWMDGSGIMPETGFFEEDFTTSLGSFTSYSVIGDQIWLWNSYDNGCAKMSGYTTGYNVNEDWLISPNINLTGKTNVKMVFREAVNYITSYDDIQVLISTNYDGASNPATQGTWAPLTGITRSTGNNWTFISSGDIDLSAYDGSTTFRVAFKYISSASGGATWEIGQVVLKESTK